MRLFLDANVLFTAAHNANGKAALVIELGQSGAWALFTSDYAWEEARRNLRIKFPGRLTALEALRPHFSVARFQRDAPCPAQLAVKDRPIFQAAFACRATHLLTGDLKDFGPLMSRPAETFGIDIQTVAQFLARIASA